MKKVLVFNDFVSWGRIAGSQVDAILTYKNIDVLFLPTALISNIFSEGGVAILDTSSYLEESLERWKNLDHDFDAVFVGYLKDSKQKDLIINFIESLDYRPLVVHDPIMADNGSLYKGVDPSIVDVHRDMANFADIILPNLTEAKFISNKKEASLEEILESIGDKKKKVIITSVNDKDSYKIISYNKGLIEKIPYQHVDRSFAGTGDIFDGIFLANYLETRDFNQSIVNTKNIITQILERKLIDDKNSIDIKIERYLDLL